MVECLGAVGCTAAGCAWDLPWCFSPVQLHPEPAWRVHAAPGLPEAAAGQQGALGGTAPAAAGAAAAGERGAQEAAAGRAAEADRGAEGAETKAGGGNWLERSQTRALGAEQQCLLTGPTLCVLRDRALTSLDGKPRRFVVLNKASVHTCCV